MQRAIVYRFDILSIHQAFLPFTVHTSTSYIIGSVPQAFEERQIMCFTCRLASKSPAIYVTMLPDPMVKIVQAQCDMMKMPAPTSLGNWRLHLRDAPDYIRRRVYRQVEARTGGIA